MARPRPLRGKAPRFTVFLDRDGVFNVHPGRFPFQVRRWSKFHWLPGAREAFARLNRGDIQTCLATNQPGTGVGLSTPGMIRSLHHRMQVALEDAGGRLDHIEACFAPPGLGHRRRKPKAGMLEDGAKALGTVDKTRAVMIGDKIRDAQAAAAFGIPAILLATTCTAEELEEKARRDNVPFVAIVPDLDAAVDLVLGWL